VYSGPRMNILLYPYSLGSRAVSRVKDKLFQAGLFASKRVGLKVVSVGNISLGGTGKTPLVLEIIKHLQAEGVRTALVTRGYLGRWEKHGGILSDGQTLFGRWQDSGDEPFMIARNAPGAGVFVGRNRLRSCRIAKVKGFAAAVLDDGFQHRKLRRDLDIVLYNPKEKILREPTGALSRAQAVLLPEAESQDREFLARRFPKARIFSYTVVSKGLVKVGGKHPAAPAAEFRGQPAMAFCGIARPQRFFDLLQSQGLELTGMMTFRDHHPYPESTLNTILLRYRQLNPRLAVTTEKDAVKLAEYPGLLQELPLYYLKIGLRIEPGFFDMVRGAVRRGERHR